MLGVCGSEALLFSSPFCSPAEGSSSSGGKEPSCSCRACSPGGLAGIATAPPTKVVSSSSSLPPPTARAISPPPLSSMDQSVTRLSAPAKSANCACACLALCKACSTMLAPEPPEAPPRTIFQCHRLVHLCVCVCVCVCVVSLRCASHFALARFALSRFSHMSRFVS